MPNIDINFHKIIGDYFKTLQIRCLVIKGDVYHQKKDRNLVGSIIKDFREIDILEILPATIINDNICLEENYSLVFNEKFLARIKGKPVVLSSNLEAVLLVWEIKIKDKKHYIYKSFEDVSTTGILELSGGIG